ncbi:MAG: response regulator transcription factor [Bacteroidia bacterium]
MKLALCDDHQLFRKGLRQLIEDFSIPTEILWEAENGKDALHYIRSGMVPDILLLDAQMPVMDGEQAASILRVEFPKVNVLVLSMLDDEARILFLLRQGVRGFISKDIRPEELEEGLLMVSKGGYYFSDAATAHMLETIQGNKKVSDKEALSDKETQFLALSCSELTYKEIAEKMQLSIKTVDHYRISLFEKFDVKSRVGLVIYALKHGLVHL